MTDDRRVLRDRELVGLFADEPELLAILDAFAATQRKAPRFLALRDRRLVALVAVVAAIVVPAVAFASQIGQLLGLSNPGSRIVTSQLPGWQLPALRAIALPAQGIRLLGERDGLSFYAGTRTDGSYCFGIGFAAATSPRIDALDCGDQLSGFPSAASPVADLSSVSHARNGVVNVDTLAGFAIDDVTRIELLDHAGNVLYSAPVVDNIYAAHPPQLPSASIAAISSDGAVIYQKKLGVARPVPSPSAKPGPAGASTLQSEPDRTSTP